MWTTPKLAASISPATSHFSDYFSNHFPNSFAFYNTDAVEIIDIVSSFKNKNSSGIDNIPISIVKSTITAVAKLVSDIINSSFVNGIFPDLLKLAVVHPVFKSGEKSNIKNYRPISVLPSFSKFFEKAVFNRLLSFLDLNKTLCDFQYGFRSRHSTFMPLIDMCDRVSKAIDKKEYSVGVFIDLSKAFDTLSHDILLKKLELYGIRGISLEWFKLFTQ